MFGRINEFGDTDVIALEGAWDFCAARKIRRLLLSAGTSAGSILVDLSRIVQAESSVAAMGINGHFPRFFGNAPSIGDQAIPHGEKHRLLPA
ncbi:MAG: hypothetical protein FJ311_16235 [Rhodospirillales bacterium]|nr:hypothetical protein [Rhodospirillales bacterium]